MLLEVRNLSKVYKKGNRQVKANDNITFSVEQGDVLGILGPNGAGKTTLIKQIATLLIPDQGDILYRGVSLVKKPEVIRGRFSFLLEGTQNVYHYLTGEANVLYFAYLNHVPTSVAKSRCEELLKKLNLYDVKDQYVFTYSAGMRKKLAIATCLINDPEVVFLDEPLSGLDVIAAAELTESIKSWVNDRGKTVIVASHRMDFVEKVTNRVLWLKEGIVALEGKTEDLKNLSKEEEYILYLRNSAEAREKLCKYDLQFEVLSDVTLKTTLRLGQKELFYSVFSDPDFEVLNLEKKSPDFEAIFRRLYGEYGEGNQSRVF